MFNDTDSKPNINIMDSWYTNMSLNVKNTYRIQYPM